MRSILGVWGTLRPSPHRFDNFILLFGRKLSQTVPRVHVGANYFRGEQLEYLEYRQYFGSIYCEYSQNFGVLYCGYSLYSKYFGVRYCGYSGTRSILTAHTPSSRSIQAFGTAHTPSAHSIQAFSTAHTPSTRSTKCTRCSRILEVRSILGAFVQQCQYHDNVTGYENKK